MTLAGEGLKLGGTAALGAAGKPVFKGQNIFTGGLKGDPMGRWNGSFDALAAPKFYLYGPLLDPSRLFAFRQIAQAATCLRVGGEAVFQNTVILVQLERDMPLDYWVLARPNQWFAAKTIRSGHIEDLSSKWQKREVFRLTAPAALTPGQAAAVEEAGRALVEADADLADARRRVDQAVSDVQAGTASTLRQLIADGDPRTAGLALDGLKPGSMSLTGIRLAGDEIVGTDLLFRFVIPDAPLRSYLVYALEQLAERANERTGEPIVNSPAILEILVPRDLGPVLAAIADYARSDRPQMFEDAHRRLDEVVGQAMGLSVAEVDWIAERMRTDPFLSEVKPMYAYRGFRKQPYSAPDGGDRYN